MYFQFSRQFVNSRFLLDFICDDTYKVFFVSVFISIHLFKQHCLFFKMTFNIVVLLFKSLQHFLNNEWVHNIHR